MEHEQTTVIIWTPELFYDDVADQFVISWASTILGRFKRGPTPTVKTYYYLFPRI
ncbi:MULTISPECIES: hypothetical protein [unclassified Spirosoma]|uniref:hypothetical protein n=1 Tax=unclassified Spirosoma TaxID=2621999 RepID=UPI000A925DB3|nr:MULTISPECIES: hypothetical protein [unclassified Spirosoma]MBN8822672.1 hypothetical protein [Spirosoma sp.]